MVANSREVPSVDLFNYIIEHEAITSIPEQMARKHKMIPIFRVMDTLTLAISDPSNVIALDEAKAHSGCDIQLVRADENEIMMVIDQNYNVSNSIEDIISGLQGMKADFIHDKKVDPYRIQKICEEPPVVKLVNLFIFQALKDKASDIHIEPKKDKVKVRVRIDGVLHTTASLPLEMLMPVVSRIKILAQLNIAEMRQPQDGHFSMHLGEREVDIRVSTFPVAYGEKVEMRIFDRTVSLLGLKKLGFSQEALKVFEGMIQKPYGIILVTGPTGSGKTSTLYAALSAMNSEDRNIVTLEDPREYLLENINQAEVNSAIGFTFANGLRAILRQDPDVVMIGEIRDSETAQIAIRAALTGHLVLSTLHTNDAAGAVTRLIDMDVEPFLIASCLIGVLAQRLVRVICPQCKEKYEASEEMAAKIGAGSNNKILLSRGKGCLHCRRTGYQGRAGVYELMVMDDTLRALVVKNLPSAELKKTAQKQGMKTLLEDGFEKALKGVTTFEEVIRVASELTEM